ncbi:hypothetical protein, partial [Kitasatospora sp. NPDC093558]|uniref:hypothetical protein n=1 Tax=Kitasatospora sp. NPDC093558 TaxID=3155201 RepID=UPI0034434C12
RMCAKLIIWSPTASTSAPSAARGIRRSPPVSVEPSTLLVVRRERAAHGLTERFLGLLKAHAA